MPNWEYKIITSGPLGFASPQLLEQHLNQLGKEEWEIVHFQTRADNSLAFYGLARRPVARDWSVEPAAATGSGLKSGVIPAPPEEKAAAALDPDELRAEAEQRRESLLAREESLRPVHDGRPEATDGSADAAELDTFADDGDLPTFFEAIRPHLRRNQKEPGLAASVEYLARKFGQTEADLIEALKECGFTIPSSPKDPPACLEYDGDLFWLNLNHRRQLWINTREKPRPAFKTAPGRKVAAGETPDMGNRIPERGEKRPEEKSSAPSGIPDPKSEMGTAEPLPAGPDLLDRLRPLMRRNRRDAGLSGSLGYLARALKTDPGSLEAAFGALGLGLPPGSGEKPVFVEIGAFVYWLNRDKSGQTWINTRERVPREPAAAEAAGPPGKLPLEPSAESAPAPAKGSPLAAVRLLLKPTRRGGAAAEVGHLAKQLHRNAEELLAALSDAGLKVPERSREKPVFAEHAGEIFWLNRNLRGELWLNAKTSKFAGGAADQIDSAASAATDGPGAGGKPRRPRKKKNETVEE